MKKKNNGVLVGLLIGIIITILIIIVLFATNTISLNSNKTDKNSADKSNINNKDSDEDKYSSIIDEYKKAMNDTTYIDNTNNEEKYPNINNNMMHHYHSHLNGTYDGKVSFYYSYYDINKDNQNELVVTLDKNNIVEIYTYNGNKPTRFFNEECLGERCSTKIYDSGMMYFYGAGGANIHGLSFFKISKDGYTKETIASYTVEYDENQNVSITDDITNNKTNYNTDEQVISNVQDNANEIELNKLKWFEIK